jgi:PhzF family phenazine biosynthesis protein
MRLRLPYRVVDAFTSEPFSGNPAAVVLPADVVEGGLSAETLPDPVLQAIAAEMNLSETAFPYPAGEGGVRRLRWFTPATEVTLCGHATLAAAHALLEAGAHAPLRFASLSGPLEVHRHGDGRLRLDFPADPPVEGPPPPGLLAALGIPSGHGVRFATGTRCALLEVTSGGREFLEALTPDMQALGGVQLPSGVMGVSVTTRLSTARDGAGEAAHASPPGSAAGPDFASRFFGPWVGVDEDPVTGMAHCLLGPWWSRRLQGHDRADLEAVQGGHRRGRLRVEVRGDRVHLVGDAVTVAEGTLHLPDQNRATTVT